MKDDTQGPARSRELFLELTQDIPDLQVRAAALLAFTTGRRMAEILSGESLTPRVTTDSAPVPDPRDRAEAFSDGLVNRSS